MLVVLSHSRGNSSFVAIKNISTIKLTPGMTFLIAYLDASQGGTGLLFRNCQEPDLTGWAPNRGRPERMPGSAEASLITSVLPSKSCPLQDRTQRFTFFSSMSTKPKPLGWPVTGSTLISADAMGNPFSANHLLNPASSTSYGRSPTKIFLLGKHTLRSSHFL